MIKQIVKVPFKPTPCRCCGAPNNALAGDTIPNEGDVSVCAQCLTPGIITKTFGIRAPKDQAERMTCISAIAELVSEAEEVQQTFTEKALLHDLAQFLQHVADLTSGREEVREFQKQLAGLLKRIRTALA